jgi:hypothetical protein
MTSLLSLILPALVPAVADGARGLIAKFTGGAGGQPQNIKERIELMKAESEKLQALAALDTPTGEPSKWIINLRASFRYIIISSIMIFTGIIVFNSDVVGTTVVAIFLDMTGACMSFVIGERMYLAIKR